MISKAITLKLQRGPYDKFEAVLTSEQMEAIRDEFRQTPEWEHFLEYCEWAAGRRGDGPAAPFVEKFDKKLLGIIGERTEYVLPMLWPVMDAMRDERLLH